MCGRCSALFGLLLFVSCGPKPELKFVEPPKNQVTIAYLKSLYHGYPQLIEQDIVISGVLVSTDQQNNFYKTLVLEDPTGGVEVKVDRAELYTLGYLRGKSYSVRCNSLTLGAYGGSVQLGAPSSDPRYQVGAIPESSINSYIKQTEQADNITTQPPIISIGELTPKHINCVAVVGRVQVIDQQLGLTWCDEAEPTVRNLVDTNGDTIDVYTRPEALFAQQLLPWGSGYVEGVVGYFNGRYQLRIAFYHADALLDPRMVIQSPP